MTPSERQRLFDRTRAAVVRGQTDLMRMTRDDLVKLLKAAEAQIRATLADEPSDYERWNLPQLALEVRRALTEFGEKGGARVTNAAGSAWQLGQDLVDKPFDAAAPAARAAEGLQRLNTTQLTAMRAFMVNRVKDIGAEAGNKILAELGLVSIGTQSPGSAITRVTQILGEESRARARRIVRTELGRVFSVASQARLEQMAERVPGLKKVWRRSGKLHPRLHHVLADGQVREVKEPFVLKPLGKAEVKLMHPHDPKAPASEVIECGCVSVPHFEQFRVPGFKLLTRAEHLKRQGLPADTEPYGVEHDGDTIADVLARQKARAPALA